MRKQSRSSIIKAIDKLFSLYIRSRDKYTCQRCGTTHPTNAMGLHNSHFYGRGNMGTRWDTENCDALCYGCHIIWGSTRREEYREYKRKQLGENKLRALDVRGRSTVKLSMGQLKELLDVWKARTRGERG